MERKTTLPRLNREWHLSHKMPKNASLDQRIAWHEEHARHCGCREIPRSILEELARRRADPTDAPGST